MAKKKVMPAVSAFDDGNVVKQDCLEIDVKLAFKRVNKKSPFHDKVVCWWTKSKFYHVEVIIGDIWISSDGKNGVHVKDVDETISEWDIVTLPKAVVTQKQFDGLITWVGKQINSNYDYFGLFAWFLFKINIQKQREWFCSEVSTATLQRLLYSEVLDIEANTVSPGYLAKLYGLE